MPKTYLLTRTQWVPQPTEVAFDFFSRASNLQSITPPWLDFKITEAPENLVAGSLIRYKLRLRGFPVNWITEISAWNPPHRFVDIQLKGPYALWHHEHTFTPEREGTIIADRVHYSLPFGVLGQMAEFLMVRGDLKKIFDYRSEKMAELLG